MAEYFRIATKDFCNTLLPGAFTGDTTMCPTRSQIESAGLYIKKGYTYPADQLVPEDHIERLDWEYTFSVTPTTATISAAGGSQKFTATSYKRQYSTSSSGNHVYVEGSQTNVGYTSENSGSGTWTAASDTVSYEANSGGEEKTGTITWTQSESFGTDPKKTATATYQQNADSISSYDNPVVDAFSYPVIPAAGGTVSPSYTYHQAVHWVSGRTTTLTSGGNLTFNRTSGTATVNASSGLADAGSKGTTPSGQTIVAVVSLTITMNGKSSSASSANVSQAANSSRDEWNPWKVTCTPNPTTISAAGGTSTLSGTASRTGTKFWDSGSTQPLSSGNQTVTVFSIVSPVTGFSISGSTVTAAANGATSTRSVRVGSTYSSVNSPEATITQSAASIATTTDYEFTVTPTSLSFTRDGGSQTVSIVSRARPQYTNDVSGEVSYGNWSAVGYSSSSTSSAFSSTTPAGTGANSASVSVGVNTGAARSAAITYTQSGTGTQKTVSCSQAAGIRTRSVRRYVFSVSPTSASFSASGESIVLDITSYYETALQSSTDGGSSWTTGAWGGKTGVIPGSRLGSSLSAFSVGAASGSDGNYTVSVSVGANSGTSGRSDSLSLSQVRSGIDSGGISFPLTAKINVSLNQKGREHTFIYTVTNNNKDGYSFMYNNFVGNYEIKPFSTKEFYNTPLGEGSVIISRGDVIFDFSGSRNILSITSEKTVANSLFNVHVDNKRVTSSIVNPTGSSSTYTVRVTLHISDGSTAYYDIIHYS